MTYVNSRRAASPATDRSPTDISIIGAPRIVREQWFGIDENGQPLLPDRNENTAEAGFSDPTVRLRYQHLISLLHGLGERPVGEFVEELVGAEAMSVADTIALLERYVRLDPAIIEALGGHDFPPAPLTAVSKTAFGCNCLGQRRASIGSQDDGSA